MLNMPRARTSTTPEEPTFVSASPSTPRSFNPILVVLLVVAAFLIGALTTKIQYLEKSPTTAQAPAAGQPAAGQPPVAQPATGKVAEITDKDHMRGNKDAKVTLVEYSDLECPFCQRFHVTMVDLMKTYGDKVKWVYRHYPLSFHANAQKEAEAAECVAELGGHDKFWEFIDAIFEKSTTGGTGFALDKLGPLAAELGVNQAQFQSCLDSGKYAQLVKDQTADGTQAGVSGTPSTFIIDAKGNSQVVVGAQPVESLKTLIDEALKK
jgi:protein-disulfide isomerase